MVKTVGSSCGSRTEATGSVDAILNTASCSGTVRT